MHTTTVRLFKVVIQLRGRQVAYPEMDGEKSLTLMERLSKQFTPVALTSANGIDEVLSLEDMRDIYQDWITQ